MMILQGGVYLYTREAVQNRHQLDAFTAIGAGYVGPIPIPVILAAAIFAIGYVALRYTLYGRYLYAVGANQKAARLSGLRAERLKLVAFVVTGLCVGVAGLVLCSLMNAGQPTAGRGFELTVIAAVILGGTSLAGGRGTLVGTLLGVLVLKVIDNGIIILAGTRTCRWSCPASSSSSPPGSTSSGGRPMPAESPPSGAEHGRARRRSRCAASASASRASSRSTAST